MLAPQPHPGYPAYERYFYPEALAPRPRRRLRNTVLAGCLAVVVLVAIVVFALAALLFAVARYHPCTLRCGPRVSSPAVGTSTFHSKDFGYEVDYPSDWEVQSQDGGGVTFSTYAGVLIVRGHRGGSSDTQLVQSTVKGLSSSRWQAVEPVGPIRGARIGFQDGKGTLYAANYLPPGSQAVKTRLAVIAATKGGLSMTVVGMGESHTADVPSGLREADVFDYVLSEFRWPPEPTS